MSNQDRSNAPSKEAITAYWLPRMAEKGVTGEEFTADECWACGRKAKLDRCHLVSYAFGGTETVDNLVLLCGAHHSDSENLSPEVFWTWLQNTRKAEWQAPSARLMETWSRAGIRLMLDEALPQIGEERAVHKAAALVLQGYNGDLA